jgi:hypothetical protein
MIFSHVLFLTGTDQVVPNALYQTVWMASLEKSSSQSGRQED